MALAQLQVAARHSQALDSLFELIAFRRIAARLDQSNAWTSADVILKLRTVRSKPTQANCTHFVPCSGFWWGKCSWAGIRSIRGCNTLENPSPCATRLSPVIVLIPIKRPSESYSPPPLLPGLIAAVVWTMRML